MTASGVVVGIDTAGPVVGVALWSGGRVTSRVERVQRGSEERLMPWVAELLAERGLGSADLTGVAVVTGPGAFTGLRVGLAGAAGLAMACRVPLWPASSLATRAAALPPYGAVLVMLDARKQRVYAEARVDGVTVGGPADVPAEQALAWLAGRPFVATGEGSLVYRDAVAAAGGRLAEDADAPGVEALVRLGAAGLAAGEGIDPASVEPTYLRDADVVAPAPRR